MRRYFATLTLLALLIPLILGSVFTTPDALAQDGENSSKISSLLARQVEAKLHATEAGGLEEASAAVEEGHVDILQLMQVMGTRLEDLDKQRVFIHLAQPLSQSQIAELEAMGVTLYPDSWIPPVGVHPTGLMIADMPTNKLNDLAGKDYVIRLDTTERLLEPENDLANQKINADDVWGLSYNGTGIRIAVVDTGLDTSHNDIPTPVVSKDYSNYPTIDDDVTYAGSGHGTHVAGSALGRASQTDGSTYNGTAPGADLIFMKISGSTTGVAWYDAAYYAIKAATDNYSADVITLSFGSWFDYHDGTSQIAQAVDYAVSQGVVFFKSAGNRATDDNHYSGTVDPNSTTDFISANCTVYGNGTGDNRTAFAYNLVWYDGTGTSNDLGLEYYDSSYNLLASTNQTQSESSRGTESEYSYYNYYLPGGTYTVYLKVTNNSSNSQFFHLYYDTSYNWPNAGTVKFNNPDLNYTITSPGDADSAIAIGAYTTRDEWRDYANYHWQYTYETTDNISTFSSRGPRVDTGAPPKPNIVAPGTGIISCRSNDQYPWPGGANRYFIDNDGPNTDNETNNDGDGPADYYLMSGTSMASPIAAGVAALILDKNPTWTPAQVRHALESTATDNGTPGFDNTYGWGLVDALAAVNSSLATTASYSDAAHNTACDNFTDYGTEHTVYMYGTGLLPSHNYRVAYYDGSDNKTLTHDVTSDASGNVSSQRTFAVGTDVAGTWNVIVCEPDFTPSDSYNGTWSYIITSDDFVVQQSAIPEFPTVMAAIVAFSLCVGVYLWMRRKAVPVPVKPAL